MNNYNPPYPAPPGQNGHNGARSGNRGSQDFRAGVNGNAPVPVPSGASRTNGNGVRNNAFDAARSPPTNKNTSHVPCKFFRQGTCQAGNSCPFMHSTEPTNDILPCKYFQKGNCKFGAKCALAHILPNGMRVNPPPHMRGPMIGGRQNIANYEGAPGSASLLSMQAQRGPQGPLPYGVQDEYFAQGQRSGYDTIPTIDTTFTDSNYGSPPTDSRLGVSPAQRKGLSVMDAPLPASFDSQGISHIARYGPIASSVPAHFGLDASPPTSGSAGKLADSSTLRNLHSSAFGDEARTNDHLQPAPVSSQHEEGGRRIMHSERFSRPKMLSSSVGARAPTIGKDEDDWESQFAYEEDFVPGSLHDLLTPQEKARRFSRNDEENPFRPLSGLGTPNETGSKVGSPKVGSPSRFGALFASQQQGAQASSPGGASVFGHVGSPLRNSSLHPDASPSLRALKQPTTGDISPFVSSPPRQSSMSMISQQLQRTRLTARTTSNPNVNDHTSDSHSLSTANLSSLHPGIARATSGSSVGSAPGRSSLDRAVSSSSIARSERIDEEQGLFSMEDEDDAEKRPIFGAITPTDGLRNKRFSGGYGAFSSAGKKENLMFGTSPSSTGSSGHPPGAIGGHRSTSSIGSAKDSPWNS